MILLLTFAKLAATKTSAMLVKCEKAINARFTKLEEAAEVLKTRAETKMPRLKGIGDLLETPPLVNPKDTTMTHATKPQRIRVGQPQGHDVLNQWRFLKNMLF